MPWPNPLAGAIAGRKPELIEVMQVGQSNTSGSVRVSLGHVRRHEKI
jgi:hypothetical protein